MHLTGSFGLEVPKIVRNEIGDSHLVWFGHDLNPCEANTGLVQSGLDFAGDFTLRREKVQLPVDLEQAQWGTGNRLEARAPGGPCPIAALLPDARLRPAAGALAAASSGAM